MQDVRVDRLLRKFKPYIIAAIALFLCGCAYRLALAWRLPVGYDEVFVIALGLEEIAAGGPESLIDVPLRRSAAITPLWWWLMAIPTHMAGEISLRVIRTVPVIVGLLTPGVAFLAARRRFGDRTAMLFSVLTAGSDILAFTNSRGEYFETLLTLFVVASVCRMGEGGRGWLRGALWLGLMATFFGKGLFIVGLAIVAEGVVLIVDDTHRRRRLRALAVSGLVAFLPILAWFVSADRFLSARGGLHHASLAADNVWRLAYDITFGYAESRAHMVRSVGDAAQVYLDGYVWPISVLTAIPLLTGMALSVLGCRRNGAATGLLSTDPVQDPLTSPSPPWGERVLVLDSTVQRAIVLGLSGWIALGASMVLLRGMIGARFHLMYLPALWLLAAWGFAKLDRSKTQRLLPIILGLWAAHLALAWSWTDWGGGVISVRRFLTVAVLVILMGWLAWQARSSWGRAAGGVLTFATIMASAAGAGPWRWGPSACFEPMGGSAELAQIDDYRSGRGPKPASEPGTLYIYLANYYMQSGDMARAHHFAKLAIEETPDNILAWTYLGFILDARGKPADERRVVWQRALDLKPDSAVIRNRLDAVDEPRSNPTAP